MQGLVGTPQYGLLLLYMYMEVFQQTMAHLTVLNFHIINTLHSEKSSKHQPLHTCTHILT